MTQQSIARVSTVTIDRKSIDYPKNSVRAYRYTNARPGLEGHLGTAAAKRIVTAERGEVEITIDIEALVDWMGRRAMATKSGKSNMQDGLVLARVVKREVLSKVTEDVPAYEGTEWV